MVKLIFILLLLLIFGKYTQSEFDASNMFPKSFDRGKERLDKLWNAQKIPGTFHS